MKKLSFSLPQYSSAMAKFVGEVKIGLDSVDEILGQISKVKVSHGGKIRQVSSPEILETELKYLNIAVNIKPIAFTQTDLDKFAVFLFELCSSFQLEEKKHLFENMGKILGAVGNIVNAQNMTSWESYIELLKKIKIDFDDEGNPKLENYHFYNSNTHQKFDLKPSTTEQMIEFEQIIEIKRKEYYAQKRLRRLS